jgi:predicted nucleic acid-binding protein
MGLILDCVVIAAERRGDNVTQMLKQIVAATGDQRAVLTSAGLTELVHGIYRAQTTAARNRRDSFIRELLNDVEVYPYTKEMALLAGRIFERIPGLSVVQF